MNMHYGSGQLQVIEDKEKDITFFVFLGVRGLQDTKPNLVVIPGIKSCLAEAYGKRLTVEDHFVSEVSRIETLFPKARTNPVYQFPISIFYDEEKERFKKELFLLGIKNLLATRGAFFPTRIIGGVARGITFFDREDELNTIWEFINQGKDILLSAPRRYGKTSLMYFLKDNPQNNYKVLHLDLEKLSSGIDLLSKIIITLRKDQEIAKKLSSICPEIGEPIKTVEHTKLWEYENKMRVSIKENKENWTSIGIKVFKAINNLEQNILFSFDEFTMMLENILTKYTKEQAEELLSWLKEIRANAKRYRFILSGSRNLLVYLEEMGLPNFFDDCSEVRLKPLKEDKAQLLIESILYGEGIYLSASAIKKIIELVGTTIVPYFLQVFIGEIIDFVRTKKVLPAPQEIEEIYLERVTGIDSRRYFDQFALHLSKYGAKETGARRILDRLSVEKELDKNQLSLIYQKAMGTTEEFDLVLQLLEYDFYIESDEGKYKFINQILRDWWLNFYVGQNE
jgi:DNA-directed RNA polymerase subunit F